MEGFFFTEEQHLKLSSCSFFWSLFLTKYLFLKFSIFSRSPMERIVVWSTWLGEQLLHRKTRFHRWKWELLGFIFKLTLMWLIVSALFIWQFLHKKEVWKSKISQLFLIHNEVSENQKNWVFHSVFGISRRYRHFQPLPPPISSYI